MITGGAVWDERFLDLRDKVDLFNVVKKACTGRKVMINCTFSHRQLGYSDAWLAENMNRTNSFGEVADRDYFNIWTAGTQRSPLPTHINIAIKDSQREVLHSEITREGYIVRWYIPEDEIPAKMANGKFIMGMDTSDAISRDAITGVIVDVDDLSVVGAFGANETNLVSFSSFVANFLIRYENIIFIPERKSSAQTFIDSLLLRLPQAGIDPFRRIFNKIVDEASLRKEAFQLIGIDMTKRNTQFYDERKSEFGFVTTGASRDVLYSSVLQNAAKRAGHLVRDKTLASELCGLVEKNGRIDHNSSGHDDFVVAWLLSHWLLMYGKNLQYYGIDPRRIDSVRTKQNGTEPDYEQMAFENEQENLRLELESLLSKIETATNPYEITRLEHQIRFVTSGIQHTEEEGFAIDALIKKSSEAQEQVRRISSRKMESFNTGDAWSGLARRSGYSSFGRSNNNVIYC